MSGQRTDVERQAERIARLEAQLAASRREIAALRLARDVAIKVSVWGRPRVYKDGERDGR